MNTYDFRTTFYGYQGSGDAGGKSLINWLSRQGAKHRFSGYSDKQGLATLGKFSQSFEKLQIVIERFPKTETRVNNESLRGDALSCDCFHPIVEK